MLSRANRAYHLAQCNLSQARHLFLTKHRLPHLPFVQALPWLPTQRRTILLTTHFRHLRFIHLRELEVGLRAELGRAETDNSNQEGTATVDDGWIKKTG